MRPYTIIRLLSRHPAQTLGWLGITLASGLLVACSIVAGPAPAPTPTQVAQQPPSAAQTPVPPPATPTSPPPTATLPPTTPTVAPSPTAEPAPLPGLDGTVRIVSSLPHSGATAPQSDGIANAIRMAIDERGGTIGDATLHYDRLDDASLVRGMWDLRLEAENADRAAADPDVLLFIGPYNSAAAKVSIPILNRAGLAQISPTTTYPGLTKAVEGLTTPYEPEIYYPTGVQTFFRVTPTDELQGSAAASWANSLGINTVYVLDDGEPFGHGVAVAFASAARAFGIQVIAGPEAIDPKAAEYPALAEKVRSTNPDLVYFGGIAENNAGRLWNDLRGAIPHVLLMGSDGLLGELFVRSAGPAADGTLLTANGLPPDQLPERGQEFVRKYRDTFGSDPVLYASYGYEAVQVGLDAIERCGHRDRACVLAALSATSAYQGVLGTWDFAETGDTTITTMSGFAIEDGEIRFQQLLEATR